MTKTLLKGLVAILLSGVLFTSCKKEKENILPTTKDYLSGKWNVTSFAYDYNNNKQLDEREKEAVEEEYGFIFKPDGTGYTHYYDPYYPGETDDQPFTWNFQNNDQEIRLIFTDEDYTDTAIAKIKMLDGKNCILEIPEDYDFESYIQWIIMEKVALQ